MFINCGTFFASLFFRLKMALKPYSQMQPSTRRQRLIDFNNRIRGSNEAKQIREQFGLEMESDLVKVDAHILRGERLTFKSPSDDVVEIE